MKKTTILKVYPTNEKDIKSWLVNPVINITEEATSVHGITNEMVKNMLKFVDADIILWAHPTNPFINYEIYEKAIRLFKKSSKKFDSLFSATVIKNHFWNHKKKPINHKPFSKKHVVASKLPAIFSQNGGIFIRFKKDMIKDGRFVGNKPYIFQMNEIEGWDLDHPWQLEVAKTLVKYKYAK